MSGYIGSKASVTVVSPETDSRYVNVAGDTMTGALAVNGNLTVDTSTLYVDSTNNRVGIGTSSPFSTSQISNTGWSSGAPYGTVLTVTGNNTNDENWGHLLISDSTTTTGNGGSLRFAVGATQSDLSPHAGIDGYTEGANYGGLKFLTRPNGGTSTERMRIDSSGNLLVGTTSSTFTVSPSSTGLQVQNTGQTWPITAYAVRDNIVCATTGAVSGSHTYISFYSGGANKGSITTNGTGTSYNTSSDYRLKEDVQPMTGASDRVLALNPVNFAWKVDGSRVDGFLAHEAQAVVPEAVTGSKDAVDDDGNPKYQGIDQSKLVPLLTAALQEALTEITDLKARVAALEAV